MIKKIKIALAISLIAVSTTTFAACEGFLPWGFPKVEAGAKELCQIAYFTAWSPKSKNPIYSAELLLTENVSGVEVRQGVFSQHPSINPSLQASNFDYHGTGFDRGHMAPAGDMRSDSVAMQQSFYLTNMVPQYPNLNRILWARLETQVRSKVSVNRSLFVITGPIYKQPIETLKSIREGVWIPSYTYKLIYDKNANRVAAYIMPNQPLVRGKIVDYYVTIAKLEKETGFSFFPEMSQLLKANLKEADLTKW